MTYSKVPRPLNFLLSMAMSGGGGGGEERDLENVLRRVLGNVQ